MDYARQGLDLLFQHGYFLFGGLVSICDWERRVVRVESDVLDRVGGVFGLVARHVRILVARVEPFARNYCVRAWLADMTASRIGIDRDRLNATLAG